MKVLFLDIDGVLNSVEWAKQNGYGIIAMPPKLPTKDELKWNPESVLRLRGIIELTDSKIVISSSWRGCGFNQWRKAFVLYDWPDAPVIGETPDLCERNECGFYQAKIRGDEVAAWIGTGKYVEKFVCVDDDADFRPDQPLVRTDSLVGLTQADADKCIEILGVA